MIQVEHKKLIFSLNTEEKTSQVIGNCNIKGNILIPRLIKYKKQDYIVTSICEKSFEHSSVKSIRFPPDSELQMIEKNAFSYSSIVSITIPSSITELKEGWCLNASKLKTVTLTTSNQYYMNYENQFIIGKSDSKSEEFDVLVFSPRCIKTVTIPSFIKKLASYSLSHSSIESIFIPSQVTHILSDAFSWCDKLKIVEFAADSEIEIIGENAFTGSPIESITLPSSVSCLKEGWCKDISTIININIIQKEIQNIIYYDNKFVIGKTDQKSDNFDKIIFSRRNLKNIIIPSFIKQIGPYSFDSCMDLNQVNFQPDSQLDIIDHHAFSESSIQMISIPPSCKCIGSNAFSWCKSLNFIQIPMNSELRSIGEHALTFSSIEHILIPSKVCELKEGWLNGTPDLKKVNVLPNNPYFTNLDNDFVLGKIDIYSNEYNTLIFARRNIEIVKIPSFIIKIGSYAFDMCSKLKNIEISSDSKLQIIDKNAFSTSAVKFLLVPSNVTLINQQAFSDCENLDYIEFHPNSKLQIIGENSFSFCSIKRFSIPSSLIRISRSSFYECENLSKVIINQNSKLQIIESKAFASSSIRSFIITSNVSSIGDEAFSNCIYLQIIEFDENSQIKEINCNIFKGCIDVIIMIHIKFKDHFI